MFPQSGNRLPRRTNHCSEADYILEISAALRDELGGTRAATKMIMRWTGTCDRTARNWLCGTVGPSGYHLICLARQSDAVLSVILGMGGRADLALLTDIHAVEVALAKASGAIELLKRQHSHTARLR